MSFLYKRNNKKRMQTVSSIYGRCIEATSSIKKGGEAMARLGISIYPEHASLEENIDYIQKAAKCGFNKNIQLPVKLER